MEREYEDNYIVDKFNCDPPLDEQRKYTNVKLGKPIPVNPAEALMQSCQVQTQQVVKGYLKENLN